MTKRSRLLLESITEHPRAYQRYYKHSSTINTCEVLQSWEMPYSSTINTCEVNSARRILLAKGGTTVENILPMLDALKQHTKRSAFQAIKWSQCLIYNPSSSLGMEMASNRVRISSDKTNLPKASNVCRVLLTINAVARNILSVQETKLLAQKYVLAWETVLMGNEC